ncbi:MAG: mycofactocin biosynthesis chaperone MftB [Acidimicrobiales bacterium]
MASRDVAVFDELRHWRLSDHASLRDESFGALAYHHDTRRLVFLKSRDLVELVRRLDDFASARSAVDELIAAGDRDRYIAALARLSSSGLISA